MRFDPTMKGIVRQRRSFDWSRDGWWIGSIVLLVFLSFFLRWSSMHGEGPPGTSGTFSCQSWISLRMVVETAIDFQEAKGPAMIWPTRCGQRSSRTLSTRFVCFH